MDVLEISPQIPYPPTDSGIRGIYNLLKPLAERGHKIILAANQEAADYFFSAYSAPVRNVYFGIDLNEHRIDPQPGSVAGVRDRPQGFLVGYIGRVLEMKGVDVLIRNVAQLPEAVGSVIVGNGPALDSCKRLAAELGLGNRIEFRGSVPASEVRGCLHELDALVLPSRTTRTWKDQDGCILIEAMAAEVRSLDRRPVRLLK